MKKLKAFIVLITALLCITSCGKREVNEIIKAQEHSAARIKREWKKFADTFFMLSALKDGGYSGYDLSINDFQSNEPMPEFLQYLVRNKIGVKFECVNDPKKKELCYSYKFKNLLKGKTETDILNLKIDNSNIELASPELLQKTFTIKGSDIGKGLAFAVPLNFLSLFNFSLSYDTIKKLNMLDLDTATKNRLKKINKAFYEHAKIQKNNDRYTVEFDANCVREYQKEYFAALKDDSTISTIIELFKKMLSEEEIAAFEKQWTESFQKLPEIQNGVQELVIKNGLIEKNSVRAVYDSDKSVEISYEIPDYNHILNNCVYTVAMESELHDKPAHLLFSFGSNGMYEDSKADINLFFTMNQNSAPLYSFNFGLFADTAQSENNFHTSISAAISSDPLSDHAPQAGGLTITSSGSMHKTKDEVNYKIDTIAMSYQTADKAAETLRIGTDFTIFANKTVPKLFQLPEEKLNILTIKDWTAVQNELQQNLMILQSQLNIQ